MIFVISFASWEVLYIQAVTELVCRRCNKQKSISEFDRAFFGKKGYDTYCHDCRKEINKIEENLTEKECRQCKKTKKISEFDRNASTRDGFAKECIECINLNNQRRRERANRDNWDGKVNICNMCGLQKPSYEFIRRMNRFGNFMYCRTCISMINRKKVLGFEQNRELNGWPIQKRCKECGRTLSQDHFHLDRRKKDGLSDKCNECTYEWFDLWLEKVERSRSKKPKKNKLKECQICHELRPIDWFNKDKTKKDGYGVQCIKCRKDVHEEDVRIWAKQRNEKNKKLKEMKCRICKRVLPISNFSKSRDMKKGYYSHCKDCHKKMDKEFQKRWENERKKKMLEFTLETSLEKKCNICGKVLPLSKFWPRRASKDGYSHYCMDCSSKKAKKRKEFLKKRGFPEEKIPDEKRCGKCKRVLSRDNFRKNSTTSTGLDEYCRDCRNKYYREYSSRPGVIEKKKEYRRRPEVMKRHREQARKSYRKPEVKARQRAYKREYAKRDYVKKKKREYNGEYQRRPEVKARRREYDMRPEVKKRKAITTKKWQERKRQEKLLSQTSK